jgi:hypothetical protein
MPLSLAYYGLFGCENHHVAQTRLGCQLAAVRTLAYNAHVSTTGREERRGGGDGLGSCPRFRRPRRTSVSSHTCFGRLLLDPLNGHGRLLRVRRFSGTRTLNIQTEQEFLGVRAAAHDER